MSLVFLALKFGVIFSMFHFYVLFHSFPIVCLVKAKIASFSMRFRAISREKLTNFTSCNRMISMSLAQGTS